MLKPRKRLTKRQLKEDKLVTFYFQAQDYLAQKTGAILWGVGCVVVLVIVFLLYTDNQSKKEELAVIELTKARKEYFANNFDVAVNMLRKIVEDYGGTYTGVESLYYLANAHFNLRDFSAAEASFRDFLSSNGDETLKAAALAGVAACLEEQGKFDEAGRTYEQAARNYRDEFMAPQNLYRAARCYVLSGMAAQAREALNQLIEQYATSSLKSEAELLLAELAS